MEKIDQDISKSGLVTRTYTEDHDGGKMHVRVDQDISHAIKYATELRNAEQYSKEGIKKGFMHCAHIPAVTIIQLKQIGIDVYKDSAKIIVGGLKRLNMEHLLTTTKQI